MKRIVITVQENTANFAYKNFDEEIEVLVETTFCDSVQVTAPDYYLMKPERSDRMVEIHWKDFHG